MTALTDRMRTCAAAILAHKESADDPSIVPPWSFSRATQDAADLLIEASNTIESYQPHPVPMEIIPPIVARNAPPIVNELTVGQWVASGDTLIANPYRGRHTCPKCDSRAGKRVQRVGKLLVLICPVCTHEWEYQP